MRAALILHAVAHAAQWCPDDLFYPPPPPLSLPVFLSALNASAPREVAFEVPCGGSVFDEATAFASKHAISAQARDELVEASHARQARGEPVARAVVITSLHARWALRRPGTLLLLVGASLDCGAAAEEGAAGLGFFETIDEARRAALQFNGSMLVLATGPEPVVSLAEVLAEHERIRHARGGDGRFAVAVPDTRHGDGVLALPSSLFAATGTDEHDLRRQHRFYRAWWAVAHNFEEEAQEDPPETPLTCDGACPPIAVVVYHQGLEDTSTRGTFREIAGALVRGLRALGLEARVEHCVDASQGCAYVEDERRIGLATHNLQIFLDAATMVPLILQRRDFLPHFVNDVAFNFEYLPLQIDAEAVSEAASRAFEAVQNAAGSFATHAALATLQRAAVVWDYSLANVPPLATITRVEHVPLGWSTAWRMSEGLVERVRHKDIEVLFYGTLTPRRRRTLSMLRRSLLVYHANAQTDGTFAPALDALILSADVVLDLRAFDGDATREWKMPRLAKLLAAGAFVVSEGACAATDQCAAYAEGVVFTDDLAGTLAHYLARPGERSRIAARGRAFFESRTTAAALRGPVGRWLNVASV